MNQVEVRRRQIQLVSYMLGLISIWILGRKLGDNGIAYLAVALEGFGVFWCIAGANVSDALGRLLRSRNAKGQYRNAAKMRRNIFLLQGVMGLLGSVVFFGMSDFLAEKVFQVPYSRFLMLLLAPVIFIRTVSAVLLGYLQGSGSELPTAISAVLRQILYLGLGLLFCNRLGEYGAKVSALLGQDAFSAMYGGVGVTVAILISELLICLFLLVVYKGRKYSKSKKDAEGMKVTDSFVGHVRLLYRNMGGKLLLGLLESLPLWLGIVFYQKSVADHFVSADSYGIYIGKYLVLCGLVCLFLAVLVTAMTGRIAGYVRKEDVRYAKSIFKSSLRIITVYALFFAVFIAIMASQFTGILFGDERLESMLSYGSVLVIAVPLAFLFSRLLWLLGKDILVCGCAAVVDNVFIVTAMLLLNLGNAGIMALVYAGIAGAVVYAVITGLLICRQLRSGIDVLRSFAIPAGAACVTGLLCLLLGKSFTPHLGNIVTVIVCLILGCMLYLVLVMLLRCFREQELEAIPGGGVLRAVGQLLRVL